jgi:hypothetical protein
MVKVEECFTVTGNRKRKTKLQLLSLCRTDKRRKLPRLLKERGVPQECRKTIAKCITEQQPFFFLRRQGKRSGNPATSTIRNTSVPLTAKTAT